jgi:hypothetical protein
MAERARRVFVQDVLVTADALENRLAILLARHQPLTPELQAVAAGVRGLLEKARQAARGQDPPHRWFRNWWTAPLLDAAYRYLHAAQIQLVDLYDESEVESALPNVLAKIQQLSPDDPRRLRAEQLGTMTHGRARRVVLRNSLDAAYGASDAWHRRQRSFRNIIVLATAGITVLLVLVGLLVFFNPSYMPFCFEDIQQAEGAPAVTQPAPAPSAPIEAVAAFKTTSCPTGETNGRLPAPDDIVIVMLMGLLGGSLAAAVSIRNVQGAATPYDIPVALATLKVPSGALTAIAGLVAIRGNFVPGLSALDSQEQILAYALVLGYAQQLATGFLDRRAQSLAKEAPAESPVKPALEPGRSAGPPAADTARGVRQRLSGLRKR